MVNEMQNTRKSLVIAITFLVACSSILIVGATPTYVTEITNIRSGWSEGIVCDGNFTNAKEYDRDSSTGISYILVIYPNNIYMYFANNNDYLYVLVDVCPDISNNPTDYCSIVIDVDNNHSIDVFDSYENPNDRWFSITKNITGFIYEQEPEWALVNSVAGYWSSPNYNVSHRIWEFRISLNEFSNASVDVGDTIGVYLYGHLAGDGDWSFPSGIDINDFENYSHVRLVSEPDEMVVEPVYEMVNTTGADFLLGSSIILSSDFEPKENDFELSGDFNEKLFGGNAWAITIDFSNKFFKENRTLNLEIFADGKHQEISNSWTGDFAVLIKMKDASKKEVLNPSSNSITEKDGIYSLNFKEDSDVESITIISNYGFLDAMMASGFVFGKTTVKFAEI